MLKNRKKIKAYKLLEQFKFIILAVILLVIIPGKSMASGELPSSGEDATDEPTFLVNREPVSKKEYDKQLAECSSADNCKIRETTETRHGEEGSSSDGRDAHYTEHSLTIDPLPSDNDKPDNDKPVEVPDDNLLVDQNNDVIVGVALENKFVVEVSVLLGLEANCTG